MGGMTRRLTRSHAPDMNIGRSLMATHRLTTHNRAMNESANTPMAEPAEDRIANARLVELQARIDARDETIRVLNEALSLALAELKLDEAA